MSQVVHVERSFATRAQAERFFDALQSTAWPYVWCLHDVGSGRWKVSALVETGQYRKVS